MSKITLKPSERFKKGDVIRVFRSHDGNYSFLKDKPFIGIIDRFEDSSNAFFVKPDPTDEYSTKFVSSNSWLREGFWVYARPGHFEECEVLDPEIWI